MNEDPATEAEQDSPIDLDRLREILFGGERQRIEELEHQLPEVKPEAQDVATILPEAITDAAGKDDRLETALYPILEHSIARSAKENPEVLAQAIYPIIGPAIRKSIAQTMRQLLEAINRTMVHSLSPSSFRWRIEAMRTGRPFAEIVLKHTLLFRVDQILLVHRDTSLLLEHVTAAEVGVQDPDVVSAMLGAIQDFVVDAFGGESREGIAQVEFGEDVLHVAQGPVASLVCVVRGYAPSSLRVSMEEVLERVHKGHARELAEFEGDPAPFVAARPQLEELLISQAADPKPKGPGRFLAAAVLGVLLLWLVIASLRSMHAANRWEGALDALGAEPGLVVISNVRDGDGGHIRGLKDAYAADPSELLRKQGIDPAGVEFAWAPFQSLESGIVERRLTEAMDPPPGVRLRLEQGHLVVSGRAPHAWCARIAASALAFPGIESLDLAGLEDADRVQVREQVLDFNTTRLRFDAGSDALDEDQAARILARLGQVQTRARAADLVLDLTLTAQIAQQFGETSTLGWRRSRALLTFFERSSAALPTISEGAPEFTETQSAVVFRLHIAGEDRER